MPVLSRSYRYIFLMAPRTGCTAVGQGVLMPHLGGEFFPREDVLDVDGRVLVDGKHGTLAQLKRHGLIGESEAAQLFKFATVRNPFDSLVTLYETLRTTYRQALDDRGSFVHKRPGMIRGIDFASHHSFSEWIEYHHHWGDRGIAKRLRHPLRRYRRPRHMYRAYIEDADYLMRFEHLQESLDEVLRQLGVIQRFEIPRMNVTNGKRDYRSYYTDKSQSIVEMIYAPDLDRFGYTF